MSRPKAKTRAENAAEELYVKLAHREGLITVGYADSHLIVHWRGTPPMNLPKFFKRLPVLVEQSGRVVPAQS